MKKSTLRTTRPPSKKYMAHIKAQLARQRALAKRIEAVLLKDHRVAASETHDAAFHLTDWLPDLEALAALFAAKRWDATKAQHTIIQFVIHATTHLAAAYRIIWGDPLEDVFGIGAVKGSGIAKKKPSQTNPGVMGRTPRQKKLAKPRTVRKPKLRKRRK